MLAMRHSENTSTGSRHSPGAATAGPVRICLNYMALPISPWEIWPVRTASAAWARMAERSAVDW